MPAVPVHDGHQVQEALRHGDVGDVRGPDLVDPINLHSLQQIGKDPVSRRWFAGVGTPVDGFQTHQPHQPSNPFSAHQIALLQQPGLRALPSLGEQVRGQSRRPGPEALSGDAGRAAPRPSTNAIRCAVGPEISDHDRPDSPLNRLSLREVGGNDVGSSAVMCALSRHGASAPRAWP